MELEARHVVAVFKAFGDENRIRGLPFPRQVRIMPKRVLMR